MNDMDEIDILEDANKLLDGVNQQLRAENARLKAVLHQIERMSRDTFKSYPGNTYNTVEAWLMAQVRTMGNIASTALVETKEVQE